MNETKNVGNYLIDNHRAALVISRHFYVIIYYKYHFNDRENTANAKKGNRHKEVLCVHADVSPYSQN